MNDASTPRPEASHLFTNAPASIDLDAPVLPRRLAPSAAVEFLAPAERLRMNQVAGHAYLNLFSFLEGAVELASIERAQEGAFDLIEGMAERAVFRFGEGETDHRRLFLHLMGIFREGSTQPCAPLDTTGRAAEKIAAAPALSTVLLTLHLSLCAREHFQHCLEPHAQGSQLFPALAVHWASHARHCVADVLSLHELVAKTTHRELEDAISGYLEVLTVVDGLLSLQAANDLEAVEHGCGRRFSLPERELMFAARRQGLRQAFLLDAMEHPEFSAALRALSAQLAVRVTARCQQLRAVDAGDRRRRSVG